MEGQGRHAGAFPHNEQLVKVWLRREGGEDEEEVLAGGGGDDPLAVPAVVIVAGVVG